LDKLCAAIAGQSGAVYAPERLVKTRTTRKLQGLGGQSAHRKELEGVYRLPRLISGGSRVLIVDDTMATGSTMEAISAAIKAALPAASVVGFVLGKAEGVYQNVPPEMRKYFLGRERDQNRSFLHSLTAGNPRKASIHKLQVPMSSAHPRPAKQFVPPKRRRGISALSRRTCACLRRCGSSCPRFGQAGTTGSGSGVDGTPRPVVECERSEPGRAVSRRHFLLSGGTYAPRHHGSQRWAQANHSLSSRPWRGPR